jgi:hypothetical protein
MLLDFVAFREQNPSLVINMTLQVLLASIREFVTNVNDEQIRENNEGEGFFPAPPVLVPHYRPERIELAIECFHRENRGFSIISEHFDMDGNLSRAGYLVIYGDFTYIVTVYYSNTHIRRPSVIRL